VKEQFLIISILLTLIAIVPYVTDIIKGATKPNLVSWITWTILASVVCVAQWMGGQPIAAVFSGSVAIETLSVVLLGLRHGYVRYTSLDVACQVGAGVGLALWWMFDSAAVAVAAMVAIDLAGAIPTIRHAWLSPAEETWSTYALSGVGAIFGFFALTRFNWISVPYVLYVVLINIVFVWVIKFSRHRTNAPI
jgi:hypothetical protein